MQNRVVIADIKSIKYKVLSHKREKEFHDLVNAERFAKAVNGRIIKVVNNLQETVEYEPVGVVLS